MPKPSTVVQLNNRIYALIADYIVRAVRYNESIHGPFSWADRENEARSVARVIMGELKADGDFTVGGFVEMVLPGLRRG